MPLRDDRRGRRATIGSGKAPLRPDFPSAGTSAASQPVVNASDALRAGNEASAVRKNRDYSAGEPPKRDAAHTSDTFEESGTPSDAHEVEQNGSSLAARSREAREGFPVAATQPRSLLEPAAVLSAMVRPFLRFGSAFLDFVNLPILGSSSVPAQEPANEESGTAVIVERSFANEVASLMQAPFESVAPSQRSQEASLPLEFAAKPRAPHEHPGPPAPNPFADTFSVSQHEPAPDRPALEKQITEHARIGGAQIESARTDVTRNGTPRTNALRIDTPWNDTAQIDKEQVGAPSIETAAATNVRRIDTARLDTAQVDTAATDVQLYTPPIDIAAATRAPQIVRAPFDRPAEARETGHSINGPQDVVTLDGASALRLDVWDYELAKKRDGNASQEKVEQNIVVAPISPRHERAVPITRLPLRPQGFDVTWTAEVPGLERSEALSRAARRDLLERLIRKPDAVSSDTIARAYHQEEGEGRAVALRVLLRNFPQAGRSAFIEALRVGSDDERALAIDGLTAIDAREELSSAFSDRVDAIAAKAALSYVGTFERADYRAALSPFIDETRVEAILKLLAGIVE